MPSTGLPNIIWPNRLRALREAKGDGEGRKLLLEDVAVACACSIGNLSRIEKGYVRPGPSLQAALADYYGVPVESLVEENAGERRLTDTNVIGAFVRQQRTDQALSLADFARRLAMAAGVSVSVSLVRLIEKGQRRFQAGDAISESLAKLVGQPSVDALRNRALESFGAGELAEVLTRLTGDTVRHLKVVPLFIDGRAGEVDAPTPALLAERLQFRPEDYVVRLDRPGFGPILPTGSYAVARRGAPLPAAGFAVLWEEAAPRIVRLFDDVEKGLVGVRDRPRAQWLLAGQHVDPVAALILPE